MDTVNMWPFFSHKHSSRCPSLSSCFFLNPQHSKGSQLLGWCETSTLFGFPETCCWEGGATALCSCREPRRQKQFGDHCWQWSWQTSSRSLWTTWPHLSGERRKFRLPTWSLPLEVDAGLSRDNSPASLQPGYALERGTSWLHPPLWAQVGEAP